MRHVDLDPVGSMIELLPRRLPSLDWAVDNLRAFGHVEFRSVAFERITACGRDGASRDEQARPRNVTLLDGLFNADIAITGAFSFDVAEGGEALFKRSARGNRGPRRAQRERSVQDVGIVSALRWIFSLQKDVSVGIDEAGQERGLRQVDYGRAGGNLGSRCIANTLDAIAVNDDHLVVPGRGGLAV